MAAMGMCINTRNGVILIVKITCFKVIVIGIDSQVSISNRLNVEVIIIEIVIDLK